MRRWLEAAAVRTVIATLRWTPLPLANFLGQAYARVLDLALPRLRRTAYRNLSFALPTADPRAVTDGVFRSIGRLLVSLARFPSINSSNVHQWIRCEGLENYLQAKRQGRGVLIATGHIGNWELSAFAHALMTEPMHVVARPLDNAEIDEIIEKRRALSGNDVILKKEAARPIIRALHRNQAVGVLVDQNSTPHEGTFVPFFGREACSGTAFARIANRTGATIIPGYAVWSEVEGRYVLHFETPVSLTGNDREDTARIQARLEGIIRRYPDQWLWIHRRWKTRPDGEDPIY